MRQATESQVSRLGELLESLPPYIHHKDESNRLFLYISKDIQNKWVASYETEGRHYYHVVNSTFSGLVYLLKCNLQEAGIIK